MISVRKGMRGPADHAVALPPEPGQEAVRPRGARDRRRHRRDRRDRPRGRPPHQDRGLLDRVRRQPQGCLHRPDGPAGPQRDVGAARREDRHRRLVRGPRRAGRARAVPGPGHLGRGRRRWRPGRPASSYPTSSSRWRSARRARTPASPPGSPAGGSTSAPTTSRPASQTTARERVALARWQSRFEITAPSRARVDRQWRVNTSPLPARSPRPPRGRSGPVWVAGNALRRTSCCG